MDVLINFVKAVGLIVGTGVIIFVAPLIFMIVFSLVSGFNESVAGDE